MEGAADFVGLKLAQVQRFLNDAFAGEGGIAMNEKQHAAATIVIFYTVLLGAYTAHGHRIHKLQVAGIEAQRDVNALTAGSFDVGRMAEVIFDVAAANV